MSNVGGRTPRRWIMRDKETNAVVFAGTTNECAEFIGCKSKTFYMAVTRDPDGIYKQWRVSEAVSQSANTEAIMKWDMFMAPLRKKYGIPIRRMVRCKTV